MPLLFDNAFVRELPGDPESGARVRQVLGALWSAVDPEPVARPRLLAHSREMVEALKLSDETVASEDFALVFGGNALWEGMQPFAANYGGHQFGNWAGQLGDGRAISLGEALVEGRRYELQLKGAGPTPYSRRADGRAVLRSSIREFLCSEAMHHLGVPTTRALSLVTTGEPVVRDMFYDGRPEEEPGAVVCRVAPSFLRFGSFELPASRRDTALLKALVDFCIRRDFPHLKGEGETLYGDWFAEVCQRTAVMVAHWMRVGFVHGVMNTDNMSVLGLTIDYGPYGWVDNYDPDWTPNTTDASHRRYRFGQQPAVAQWNLGALASALLPLFGSPDPLHAGLDRYVKTYEALEKENAARKLGLHDARDEDLALMQSLQVWMRDAEVDMTLFFRALADLEADTDNPQLFNAVFYEPQRWREHEGALRDWLQRYALRLQTDPQSAAERRARMNAVNPLYVPRNYLAQEVIDRATAGDEGAVAEFLEVLRRPYEAQPGKERWAGRRPDWARHKAGCSMLSCSS